MLGSEHNDEFYMTEDKQVGWVGGAVHAARRLCRALEPAEAARAASM